MMLIFLLNSDYRPLFLLAMDRVRIIPLVFLPFTSDAKEVAEPSPAILPHIISHKVVF